MKDYRRNLTRISLFLWKKDSLEVKLINRIWTKFAAIVPNMNMSNWTVKSTRQYDAGASRTIRNFFPSEVYIYSRREYTYNFFPVLDFFVKTMRLINLFSLLKYVHTKLKLFYFEILLFPFKRLIACLRLHLGPSDIFI